MASLSSAEKQPWRYDECACGEWKRTGSGSCGECLAILRANRIQDRFWAQVDRGGECWTWTGTTNGRYGMFFISKHGTGRGGRDFAHRMAWRFSHGDVPDGMEVMHLCDRPTCVRPSHLTIGTHAENMADMASKGRSRNAYTSAAIVRARMVDDLHRALRGCPVPAGASLDDVWRDLLVAAKSADGSWPR